VDEVFKALADPTRRALLDALFACDGQSTGQLCTVAPELTRFAVMKHLTVLQAAGLVVVIRQGRVKRHYLNPVPIVQIADRWIAKYALDPATALAELANRLDHPGRPAMPESKER
jgi:DNA-binding transcriptional ArsR family regulator